MKKILLRLIMLTICGLLFSMIISCGDETNPSEKKEQMVRLPDGKFVPISEYKANQGSENPYVKTDTNGQKNRSQYHTVEDLPNEVKVTDLSDSNIGQKITIKPLGSNKSNNLFVPDVDEEDETSIYEAPRLKKENIVVNDATLASASPELKEMYQALLKEINSLTSELKEANTKLDRLEGKISDKKLKVKEPYEVKRVQVMEEILSYMRQNMIDRSVYPLIDIPKRYMDYYTLEGCDDGVLQEIEKELAYIIELTAMSISFKQKYIFNDNKSAREKLVLNYGTYLRNPNYKKKE